MKYNFDKIIDRKGTNSTKHDFAVENGMHENVIPLWVADMDFKSPPAVPEALINAAKHGIFGYSRNSDGYFKSVHDWYKKRFNWDIEKEWLVTTPGVVFAIGIAIRALTKTGDGVIIQRPVYHPFSNLININNRKLVNNPLIYEEGKYRIDFDDFEAKIRDNNVKMFILCSPHNPIGRVWSKDELLKLGDICIKYDVIIVSDEIHSDFIYPDNKHYVFADLKDEFSDRTITCTAPSKTFNLAGLQGANIFIENEEIRRRFRDEMASIGYSQINSMALIACQAAYTYGGDWLDELIVYLMGNIDFVKKFLSENIPQIKLVEPQGTYLLWLDFKALDLTEDQREDIMVNKANLLLNKGTIFGEEGSGFERVNIASPRSILEKAFEQLAEAFRPYI